MGSGARWKATLLSVARQRKQRNPSQLHIGDGSPRVGVDLVALDRVQPGGALPPADRVDVAVEQREAELRARRLHRRHLLPHVDEGVEAPDGLGGAPVGVLAAGHEHLVVTADDETVLAAG